MGSLVTVMSSLIELSLCFVATWLLKSCWDLNPLSMHCMQAVEAASTRRLRSAHVLVLLAAAASAAGRLIGPAIKAGLNLLRMKAL